MLLVDTALQKRVSLGLPVTVGLLGTGFLGRALAKQILSAVPGIRLVAICTRGIDAALDAYAAAGATDAVAVHSAQQLEEAAARGQYAACEDPALLCNAGCIEALVDCTGAVEYSAAVALQAIENRKHFITNAELDATLGPILRVKADDAGVVFSSIDGDQPGTQMNLYRFVRAMGFKPLVCGNIKGLQDPYRTPETQKNFAERWGLSPKMATQFADGSKISFEQTSVANATGMRVARRGMLGYVHEGHVDELRTMYSVEELEACGGIVDYVLGAKPSPGVFVLASCELPWQHHYLSLYKMGDGPLYSFYAPYHLCHLEAPSAIARAVLMGDAVVAPIGAPVVEVVATAKRDLGAGDALDGIGGFTAYGQCENSGVARSENLLPLGLAEGCRVVRKIQKDSVIRFEDVVLPPARVCDRLWFEQSARFGLPAPVGIG